jgi:hypothetical protein
MEEAPMTTETEVQGGGTAQTLLWVGVILVVVVALAYFSM